MAGNDPTLHFVCAASVQVRLLDISLPNSVTIDSVELNGSDVRVEAAEASAVTCSAGETIVKATLSERNMNAMLSANLPAEGPVRALRAALLSGKIKVSGQLIRVISLPFTVDVVPLIENGIRVTWDFRDARMGIGLPKAVVEILERLFNERFTIDLSGAPVPVRLDNILCEAGRLTLTGRARLGWPLDGGDVGQPALSVLAPSDPELRRLPVAPGNAVLPSGTP